ncbi:hypothetical protein RND81_09G244800 [Saponaria officinalis]|uniref:Uncharacterized protein n=1 Tax=Saponaria officinalis TaxID=3572 RepID=A0AAW1IRX0_SAPOF
MDINLQKRRIQLFVFIVGVIVLSITAEKCRHLVGEEASSKSGQFTFLNCFDMGTGSLACSVKEGVKLYVNTFQSTHVEQARSRAMETTLTDAVSQGLDAKTAAKQAAKEGKKAAKLASRKARRITGPIISSGWDFFEAIYFGGTITEGFLRGSGTLVGTYAIGFLGEQRFGRFGYLVGSQMGSWIGGRIGLMVYDVVNGVHFLLYVAGIENTSYESPEAVYESPSEVYESRNEEYESTMETVYDTPQEAYEFKDL